LRCIDPHPPPLPRQGEATDQARRTFNGPEHPSTETKVGTFTQALYDEAKKNGWTVISMKNDWKVIFPFESK
jgi:hypothetical protein